MLAAALARSSAQDWQGKETTDDIELMSEWLEISFDQGTKLFHEMAANAARQLQSLPLPLPAFHLLYNMGAKTAVPAKSAVPPLAEPEKTAEQPAAGLQKTNTPLPQQNEIPEQTEVTKLPATESQPKDVIPPQAESEREPPPPAAITDTPPPQPEPKASPTQQDEKPEKSVISDVPAPEPKPAQTPPRRHEADVENSPAAKPEARANPLNEALSKTLKKMLGEESGLQNIMFAMPSPEKSVLKARAVYPSSSGNKLKGFHVDLSKPSLFKALLKKPLAIWINSSNMEKYGPMIPGSAKRFMCQKEFIMMSVFIHDKPIGLFYADNGCGGKRLIETQYRHFKACCQEFMQQLTQPGT
jgi:hypothetical protein